MVRTKQKSWTTPRPINGIKVSFKNMHYLYSNWQIYWVNKCKQAVCFVLKIKISCFSTMLFSLNITCNSFIPYSQNKGFLFPADSLKNHCFTIDKFRLEKKTDPFCPEKTMVWKWASLSWGSRPVGPSVQYWLPLHSDKI